jgi:hypothetical protein
MIRNWTKFRDPSNGDHMSRRCVNSHQITVTNSYIVMHRCVVTSSKFLVRPSNRWDCLVIYENNKLTAKCTTLCCSVLWHWRFGATWFFHIYGSPEILLVYLACPEDGNSNLSDISIIVTNHHSTTYRPERCEHIFISGCFPALEWQQTIRLLESSSKDNVSQNDRSTKLPCYGRVLLPVDKRVCWYSNKRASLLAVGVLAAVAM